jgi:hypothetical protein
MKIYSYNTLTWDKNKMYSSIIDDKFVWYEKIKFQTMNNWVHGNEV